MRLTVIQWFPLSQFPTKRCLDAAEGAVRVDENADVDKTEAREIAAQQSGPFASEVKQKGAAAQATARGSMSEATTRAAGRRLIRVRPIAPLPVQRSTAVPLAGSRVTARRASASLCQRGT